MTSSPYCGTRRKSVEDFLKSFVTQAVSRYVHFTCTTGTPFMARILLAEDDDSMRIFLARAIEKAGHLVTAVDRGTAALPLIATGGYDLLLTDIVMPEMDGIELAQRAAALAPKMQVMFITGFAAVAMNKRHQAPQNAKVLSKPFHLRDLVGEIDRLLAA
jgi:two-component system, cell cycle response regulator CpdR